MTTNGEDKRNGETNRINKANGNNEETLEEKYARLVRKVNSIIVMTKNGVARAKEKLREGHSSIFESIQKLVENVNEIVKQGIENDKLVDENVNVNVNVVEEEENVENVNVNVAVGNQGVAEQEEIEFIGDLDDIGFIDDVEGHIELLDDFIGIEEINGTRFDDVGGIKAGVDGLDEARGHSKSEDDNNDGLDSEDESYMAESDSADTEESLLDDYNVLDGYNECESDVEDEDVGHNHVDGPLEERNGLNDLDG